MAEETTERQGNGGVEDAQPKNGAGENIVYIAYIENYYGGSDALGMAFVAYLFYSGDSDTINAYRGEYMSSYSWASMTEAILSWRTTNR